ncbi:MAG: Gfo/Idh/MocA family oxidoreductase [Clostridia bacterium]|nr:Gfo/Idh/MocA family oxidoreductase [Clostridia bacterium]
MYKIAILGCENSHANEFLKYIIEDKVYTDIEVVGVYSDDIEAANKLNARFGVKVAESYDEFVGNVDGIVITARNGANHYKYAKPYIPYGIPMFIDKPITNTEEDAIQLKKDLMEHNVRVSGGSVLKYPQLIQDLKKVVREETYGEVYGGFLRAPVNMVNEYGNFYFYSQHLVQMMTEIFGYFPHYVQAFRKGKVITCVVRYEKYDVTLTYVDGITTYFAGVNTLEKACIDKFGFDGCFQQEFASFYNVLTGGAQEQTYDEFIAPVFIMNAIERSLNSGQLELVNRG